MSVVNVSEKDFLELEKKRKKKANNETQIEKESEASDVNSQETQNAQVSTGKKSEELNKVANKELAKEIEASNLDSVNKNDEVKAVTKKENLTPSNNEKLLSADTLNNGSKPKAEDLSKENVAQVRNSSLSDLVENLTSSKSKTAEETDNSKQNAYDELKSQVEKINDKYAIYPTKGEKIDEEISLARKDYLTKTDEEIEDEAKNSLNDYANVQKDAINQSIDTKLKALDGKEESLRAQSEIEKAELQNYYNTYKRKAENDALKRGLQRSSIVINNLNAFDKELIEKLINVDQTLGENIASINDEINSLTKERQTALDEFNITYAVKLNDKIKELKQDLQEKNDEILEYNNKIAQIEAEYKADAKKQNQKIDSDFLDEIYKYFDKQDLIKSNLQSETSTAVEKYLDSLPKDEALAELTNNAFIRDLLGTNLSYYIYKTKAR